MLSKDGRRGSEAMMLRTIAHDSEGGISSTVLIPRRRDETWRRLAGVAHARATMLRGSDHGDDGGHMYRQVKATPCRNERLHVALLVGRLLLAGRSAPVRRT
jgi:hypothetical protein